jgi:hypothetical protein
MADDARVCDTLDGEGKVEVKVEVRVEVEVEVEGAVAGAGARSGRCTFRSRCKYVWQFVSSFLCFRVKAAVH